jgi:hypothetical protein
MTWTETLLNPIYDSFGVTAEIVLSGGSTVYELIAIDKTSGVDVALQGVDSTSIHPAIVCRMAELLELDLTPADLRSAEVTINGGSWNVIAYYPKPSPLGESDGELYLMLTQVTA